MQDALRTLHQSFLTNPGSGKANSIIRHLVAETLRRLEGCQAEASQPRTQTPTLATWPSGGIKLTRRPKRRWIDSIRTLQ